MTPALLSASNSCGLEITSRVTGLKLYCEKINVEKENVFTSSVPKLVES
jgi:hypothetical protein